MWFYGYGWAVCIYFYIMFMGNRVVKGDKFGKLRGVRCKEKMSFIGVILRKK